MFYSNWYPNNGSQLTTVQITYGLQSTTRTAQPGSRIVLSIARNPKVRRGPANVGALGGSTLEIFGDIMNRWTY
jgi:hypothetical protein